MTIEVNVVDDVRAARRTLERIHRRQIPFATRLALNDMAFEARTEVVNTIYPRAFEVRATRFPRTAFRVDKATRSRPVARVFDRLKKDFLKRQAAGGVVRPGQGGRWAIKTSYVKARLTKTGRVPKRLQPRNPKAYKVGDTLFQDFKRQADAPLYTLRPSVRLPLRFTFFRDINLLVRRRFRSHFARALARAIATAR